MTPAPGNATDKKLRRDLRTLALFIELYCRHRHDGAEKSSAGPKTLDLEALSGRKLNLCGDCWKLLAHACVKRTRCPLDPKPACKHCPTHCYHPEYRRRIREVMRFSGRKMVLGGRLDYLFRLLF